jgi:hypothetical protein
VPWSPLLCTAVCGGGSSFVVTDVACGGGSSTVTTAPTSYTACKSNHNIIVHSLLISTHAKTEQKQPGLLWSGGALVPHISLHLGSMHAAACCANLTTADRAMYVVQDCAVCAMSRDCATHPVPVQCQQPLRSCRCVLQAVAVQPHVHKPLQRTCWKQPHTLGLGLQQPPFFCSALHGENHVSPCLSSMQNLMNVPKPSSISRVVGSCLGQTHSGGYDIKEDARSRRAKEDANDAHRGTCTFYLSTMARTCHRSKPSPFDSSFSS